MKPAALVAGLVQSFETAIANGQKPSDIAKKLALAVTPTPGNVPDLDPQTAAAIVAVLTEDPSTLLDACLATAYAADLNGGLPDTLAAITLALNADGNLKAAALTKLEQVSAVPERRCYLSARQKAYLSQALGM